MLHITSFVQNIAKLNNRNKSPLDVNSSPESVLNGLSRNYSFIYDHNLKRYDYHFENEEDDADGVSEGYWGYLRDRNADKKQSPLANAKLSSYDGYWGFFRDANFDPLPIAATSTTRTARTTSVDETSDELSVGVSPCSNSPSILSLSSSISSLSRFKEVCNEDEDVYAKHSTGSFFDSYEKKLEYDYNYYKTSKLKIQACKRDEMKILMQSLEDQESRFKKEVLKAFNSSSQTATTSTPPTSSSLTYPTKVKQINFLHFSNTTQTPLALACNSNNNSAESLSSRNLNNFKNVFNTLTKLKKSINIFNGDFLNLNRADLFLSFINNVHASMSDVDGMIFNYMYEKDQSLSSASSQSDLQRQTTNVSLCSNVYETLNQTSGDSEKAQKIFGYGNYSTMLFEYQNIKIGFMALIDSTVFSRLNATIRDRLKKNQQEDKDELNSSTNPIEYVDYITECDKLSKQMRLCGANIIVVLANMDELNEQRLLREGSDLDIVFSSSTSHGDDLRKMQGGDRWLIKSGTSFDCVSAVSLKLDQLNSNRILDIEITKYLID